MPIEKDTANLGHTYTRSLPVSCCSQYDPEWTNGECAQAFERDNVYGVCRKYS